MITLIVEVALAALLLIVLMNIFRNRKKPSGAAPTPLPMPDLASLKPTDARSGDVISVAGAGDEMADLDFTADRTAWFQAGSRSWMEVSGPYRERRAGLRVANEEQVEVAVSTDARKLTIEDVGVSEDDLAQMDERQNTGDSFEFDGKVWLYRLSREAQAKRDDQPQPAHFYYWEFREQNGRGLLAIRKAEGEPFAVSLYQGVAAADVTVYRDKV
jgi:hypothetical protein